MSIERELAVCLEYVEKFEYIKSYQQAAFDQDILSVAKEGIDD